ncbi:MAG: sugar phosphate isomerase/epimerase [Planctomycetaceae bacterium]|jgi:sugar phosphate isomerase/epimerase|nr:sugar phosphate isomerase/epimerase [Planctomycetaceae bacterium]
MSTFTRRSFLLTTSLVAVTPLLATPVTSETTFRFCLNAGTLRGFNLDVVEEINVAAKASYTGIELWVDRLNDYVKRGGSLTDLKKRLGDNGLNFENAMAFFAWVVNDDAKRNNGIEQMKREMTMVRELGCTRIAATASGATNERLDNFTVLGERYRTILQIGESMEVIPQLEIWGGSKTLTTLSDAVAIATAAGHPQAALLLDAYHLYKGGSPFDGLRLLNGKALNVFHVNDYPSNPPRETIQDKHRVYPGDGICPLKKIIKTLNEIGFTGALSFEIFNEEYIANDTPVGVATKGLEAMKKIVQT